MADPSSYYGTAEAPPTPAAPAAPAAKSPGSYYGIGTAQQKTQHDPNWMQRGEAALQWAATSPVAQGATAVLGAIDNTIVGSEAAATGGGNLGDIARGGWQGMTQPGQATENVQRLEKNLHMPQPGLGKGANLAQHIAQGVEDTALQSQSLLIPGLDVVGLAGKGLKLAGKLPGAAKAAGAIARAEPVERVASYFDADHLLNQLVTPRGNATFKGLSSMKTPAGKPRFTPEQIGQQMDSMNLRKPGLFQPGMTGKDAESHATFQLGAQTAEKALKNNPLTNMNPGKYVSDFQRAALFVLPFAHMKNLTVLAALGPGGVGTVAKGVKYARLISNGDAATLRRLKSLTDIGAGAEYHSAATAHMIPGMGALSSRSTKVLTDYDNGLRLALRDKLANKGIRDLEAGGQIRDIMGDYGNASKFTKDMKTIGANFPAWRMGVVPKAMAKAAREQPKATNLYSRIQSNISNDVTEPMLPGSKGNTSGFDLGGPAEDAAKLANPAGALKYLASPSTIGPLGEIPGAVSAMQNHGVGKFAMGEAEKFLPFGSIISKIPALNPWSSKEHHPITSAALSLAGMYTVDLPKLNTRMQTLKRGGLKGKALMDQMVTEGLIRPGKKPQAPPAEPTSAKAPGDYYK
jgi:hypothetical protein